MEELKVKKWRYALMLIIVLAVSAVFCLRLVSWQIIQSDRYDEIALSSFDYTIKTDAVRGEIYDVNGVKLAENITGYRVVINRLFMPEENLNDCIVRLTELLEKSGDKWEDKLPIIAELDGSYRFQEDSESEIAELKSKDQLNMNPYSTAAECMAKLVEKYGCDEYDKKQQRDIISVRYNMEKSGYSNTNPYVFADGISERSMNIISENMQSEKGIEIRSTAVRRYINGTAAPHIVGVTGLISAEEYTELKNKGYAYNDEIGKSGIESSFEKYLRGTPGSITYEVRSDGTIKESGSSAAVPGASVHLTIDSHFQKVAQDALKNAVKEANDYAKEMDDKEKGADCKGAAVVVLNVKDFSVLCAASYPTYDLSKYYKDYTKLAADKATPLFDRAFMGALAPGSTFKPMVAAAALQEGAITTKTHIDCQGIYTKNGLHLRCMSYHGSIDMFMAIKDSCNVFFAETARRLGIENMNLYARRCGLGVRTGVEVAESRGTLAGPDYSREMGSEWYESFVSPAGIGQSDNQFTPLQLATYAATIANDGVRLRTHVVDTVTSYTGDDIIYKTEPEVMDNMGVSAANIKEVQKAMNIAITNYGTFSDFPIAIAGKTGTAENSGSDHANFICYAPYDKPEIAVAVMVEHGAKSSVAMKTAKTILTEYFKDRIKTEKTE